MSPQSGPSATHSHNPSPTGTRITPALPPIIPPREPTRNVSEPHSASSVGFPPLSRASSASSNDGLNKMHHLLNPAGSHEPGSKPPTPDMNVRHQQLPPISVTRGISTGRHTPVHPPYGHHHPSGPTHRLSASNLASPTGTIDAKKSPFLPPSGSGPPMAGAPLAPTSQPYALKPGYPFPHQVPPQVAPMPRRGSDAMSAHGSRTGSPTPSYSSYGQPSTAQGSPRSQFSSIPHQGAPSIYNGHHQPGSTTPLTAPSPQSMQHSHGQIPPSQQGTAFRIFDTVDGPMQVPIDFHTASKMADEKRKRNAGASARFRQRRKEKERESATTISKLEDKVREVSEEKDFYRAERDYFRDLVYKNEGARASLVPRMPSPASMSERTRQGSLTSSRDGGHSPSSGGATEYKESGDRGSDDGRILRRRISGYEPEQRIAPHERQQEQHQHQPGTHQPTSAPGAQHANGLYAYQGADSRGSALAHGHSSHVQSHMQAMSSVPQSMRTGPYEPNGHGSHVAYESRWAAPS